MAKWKANIIVDTNRFEDVFISSTEEWTEFLKKYKKAGGSPKSLEDLAESISDRVRFVKFDHEKKAYIFSAYQQPNENPLEETLADFTKKYGLDLKPE